METGWILQEFMKYSTEYHIYIKILHYLSGTLHKKLIHENNTSYFPLWLFNRDPSSPEQPG